MSEPGQSGDPAKIVTPTSFKYVYAVNTELVRAVEAALADDHGAALRELLADMRPADIADLVVVLGDDLDIDTLIDLEGSVLKDLLAVMSPHTVARTIPELDTDEAVHPLKEMDEARHDQVLARVPALDRAAVLEGLSFPEDSAERLMQRDLIAVPAYWSVGQVIDYCRYTADFPDHFYEIFVIDPRYRPIGQVALNRLMRTQRPVLMREIMEAEATTIPVNMDQEEVPVGALNGVLFSILVGLIAAFWFSAPSLGFVITFAMVVNMVVAGLAGTLIPLGLARAGTDPAVAATMFLKAVTDVVGFFVYLGLAALFLL